MLAWLRPPTPPFFGNARIFTAPSTATRPLAIKYIIDIDILTNSWIDIDINIFKSVLINMDINIYKISHWIKFPEERYDKNM